MVVVVVVVVVVVGSVTKDLHFVGSPLLQKKSSFHAYYRVLSPLNEIH